MLETLPPPIWVDTKQALQAMVTELTARERVAVDTESNSLHAYRERVCLVQFSTPRADYLVDPIALNDLRALSPVFANKKIEKIFHASEYDLICLSRDFGFQFANLFDTMHAARILGYKAVGLDSLLGEKFNITMDKRHQKANWGARPLKPEQALYARLDTHYLFDLRDALEQELRAKDLFELALEDFARACETNGAKPANLNISFKRFSLRKDISARELTVLKELCETRDVIAKKLDRPTFKVFNDNMLIAIARGQPQKKVDLSGIGLSERQIHLWGHEALEAVKRGVRAPLVEREQVKPLNDAVVKRLEKIKAWRKKTAQGMDVESDVVLPKQYVSALANRPPKNMNELKSIMADSPWRAEKFGAQILKLFGG